jgi:hypothetical protein
MNSKSRQTIVSLTNPQLVEKGRKMMTMDPDVNDRKCLFRAGPTGATIATWRAQLELSNA